VDVTASLAPPPVGPAQAQLPPPNFGYGPFGEFSGMFTNVNAPLGLSGFGFGAGGAVHVFHADVTATIGDNGSIAFNLPLDPFEATLDGDVVSVTASLPNGAPLPSWLQFNAETGKFAGLVPDDILTGSIRPDGGFTTGPGNSVLPQSITIEVTARDSKGDISVIDFTIDLSQKTQQHGWNMSPEHRALDPRDPLDPWGQIRPRRHLALDSGFGPHRDLTLPISADHVLWHDRAAIDIDQVRSMQAAERVPAGRAGFSDQLRTHGWHAVTAERTALLDSLRQVATTWQ
jgi:hypothetical protein